MQLELDQGARLLAGLLHESINSVVHASRFKAVYSTYVGSLTAIELKYLDRQIHKHFREHSLKEENDE
jgi:hypothetical protein